MTQPSAKSELGSGSVIGIVAAVVLAPFLAPFVILVGIFLLLGIVLWVAPDSFPKDYKITSQETIATCSGGGDVKKVSYDVAGGDYKESLVYYTFGEKKISLDGNMSEDFVEANPNQNFENYRKYSILSKYSWIPLIQKDEVIIINEKKILDAKNKFSFNSDSAYSRFEGVDALYLNSNEITEGEFKSILECLKDSKDNLYIPAVVSYQPNILKFDIYSPSSKTMELQYKCKSPSITLNVGLNGSVYLSDIPNEYALYGVNYSSNADIPRMMTNSDQFRVGYMTENGDIYRYPDLDLAYTVRDKKSSKYLPIKDFPFEQVRQEIKMISLIFDENQNPINSYLQSCKNADGNSAVFY